MPNFITHKEDRAFPIFTIENNRGKMRSDCDCVQKKILILSLLLVITLYQASYSQVNNQMNQESITYPASIENYREMQ